MPRHGLAVTPDRVCVPSAPMAGCQCSPLSGYPCGCRYLTGYLCLSRALPRSGTGSRSHPALLPPSAPSLSLLRCLGVCSERLWERGCSPGSWGARRLLLPPPSLPPPGSSKLSRWREPRRIQGAQGRPEAPGFRRSPPALRDTCDLLFCVLFYLPHSLPLPQRGPAEKSLGNSLSRLSLPSACLRARERENEQFHEITYRKISCPLKRKR